MTSQYTNKGKLVKTAYQYNNPTYLSAMNKYYVKIITPTNSSTKIMH